MKIFFTNLAKFILRSLKQGKKTILVSFWIVVITYQYLSWTGFCYAEKRYLSEEEIIKRVVSINRNNALKTEYKKNPYCCEIRNQPEFLGIFEILFNHLFGFHVYEVDVYYKKDFKSLKKYDRYPYLMDGISTNSCASKIFDVYGESISEKQYQSNIRRIRDDIK